MLPPLCGKAIIASDVAANGKFENSTVLNKQRAHRR